MMENLVWKAYYHSMSGHEIRPFNIFEHGRFREEVRKLLLKCTLKGEDTDAIKAATEELTQAFYKMSEKLYQQQAPQGDAAAQQPGGDTGAQGGQYYDADYKVVDDDDQNK